MALVLVLTNAPLSEQVLPALELLSHRTRQIPAEPAPSSCTGVAAEAAAGAGIIGRLLARGRRDLAGEMTPVR